MRAENVVIRTGGGYVRFEDYVPENEKYFQRVLVNHMMNNDESLEWVIENLILGTRLKQSNIQQQPRKRLSSPVKKSPKSPIANRITSKGRPPTGVKR